MKFILASFLAIISCTNYAQNYIEHLIQLQAERKYSEAFTYGGNKILELRDQKKRNHYLEFLTWTSLAQSSSEKDKSCGCKVLSDYWSIKKKYFSFYDREILKSKYDSICLTNLYPSFPSSIYYSWSDNSKRYKRFEGVAYLESKFKKFYELIQLNSIDSYRQRDIFSHWEELSHGKREVTHEYISAETDDSSKISNLYLKNIAKTKSYIHKLYKNIIFFETSKFVLASKNKTLNDLNITAKEIERVYNYYVEDLGIPKYPNKILIFLSDSFDDVDNDIYKLYGDYVSSAFGYSNLATGSICAWIPSNKGIGTIKHELIHLLSSNNALILPDWFEEGLASLFEESKFNASGDLIPQNNWRLKFLEKLNTNLVDSLFKKIILNSDRYEFFLDASTCRTIQQLIEQGYEKMDEMVLKLQKDLNSSFLNERKRTVLKEYLDVYSSPRRRFMAIEEGVTYLKDIRNEFAEACADAMGRYIFIYLKEKGKLSGLLRLIEKQNENLLSAHSYNTFVELFLKALNFTNVTEAEKDFIKWYSEKIDK